jgi:putative membrane protein
MTENAMDKLLSSLGLQHLLSTIIYALVGMIVFGVAFVVFNRLMPFSVRKEIEDDQNTALGVIIGAMLIGIAIIIAAAIVG